MSGSTTIRPTWRDFDFADSVVAAGQRGAHPGLKVLLLTLFALFASAFYWASIAVIDEVARTEGRVIPSGRSQVIQSLEGGIIDQILVQAGDRVAKGQILIRIDDTGVSSDLGELIAQFQILQARVTRLDAEAKGVELIFPQSLATEAPEIIARELTLFRTRLANQTSRLDIVHEQQLQKEQELTNLNDRLPLLEKSVSLIRQEIGLMRASGVIPRAKILPLERDLNARLQEHQSTLSEIVQLESGIREAGKRYQELELGFKQQAETDYVTAKGELTVIVERIRAARDKVVRTEIRSPVEGIVSDVNVNTLGGVIASGAQILEIVPIDDSLLIEAKARPEDIAFITPKQRATVKISAYDFTVYGTVEGEVERVGADSLVDDVTGLRYFPITIRTKDKSLVFNGEELPIRPGMMASVDILTGRKSVLNYLLKPFNKARYEALSER